MAFLNASVAHNCPRLAIVGLAGCLVQAVFASRHSQAIILTCRSRHRRTCPRKTPFVRRNHLSLQKIPNMVAVVLGGSYASGLPRSDSDVDIGLYYRQASPFLVDRVRSVAENICVSGNTPVVTDFYARGPWVNGGASIQTPTA